MNRFLLIILLFFNSFFLFAQSSFETIVKSDFIGEKTILGIQEWNGNYILAGGVYPKTGNQYWAYLLVLQNNGNVILDTTVLTDNTYSNLFFNIHQLDNRLFLLGKITKTNNPNQSYLWFTEMDTSFHLVQEKELSIPQDYQCGLTQSIIDSDDNLVVSGHVYQNTKRFSWNYPAFYKINLAGDSLCSKFMIDSTDRTKSVESIIESADHSKYYAFGMKFKQGAGLPYTQMLTLNKNFDSIGIVKGVPHDVHEFSTPAYINDTTMVAGGQVGIKMQGSMFNSPQMGITSFNPESENIVCPAINYAHFTRDSNKVDYTCFIEPLSYNGDYLYFGGTSNVDLLNIAYSSHPSWFHLVKLNTDLSPVWERWYSHKDDACYVAHCTFATSDGGCIMTGSRYDGNPEFVTDVYVIKVDANGDVLWTKEIDIQQHISVYPNPGTDNMHIEMSSATEFPYYIELFNIHGMLIQQAEGYTQTLTLSTQHLSAGVYVYKIYNQKHQLLGTGKWVKR